MESYTDVSFGLFGDLESYYKEDIENEQIHTTSRLLLIPIQQVDTV